jgi:hypothetical protein
MKALMIFSLACLMVACSSVSPTPVVTESAVKPFVLEGTQVFTLDSAETGNSYQVVVSLPGGYDPTDKSKTYPVLYVLDSQWHFPLIYTATGAVIHDGDMPPSILVGVSWADSSNLMALRNLDLTPTPMPENKLSGGADKFQVFLRDQLFPHIEANYQASQHRTVSGGSSGALFVLYTLLSQPDLFTGYISSSPSLFWDNQMMFGLLDRFPVDGFNEPKRVYLAWGGLEDPRLFTQFAEQLNSKQVANLEFKYAEVSNAGHAGVNAECFTRGFQHVYEKPDVSVSAAVLDRLSGTYKMKDEEYSLKFTHSTGKLRIHFLPGDIEVDMRAQNDHEFYIRGHNVVIRFSPDGNKLTRTHYGRMAEYERVSIDE